MSVSQINNAKVEKLIKMDYGDKVIKAVEEQSIVMKVGKSFPVSTKRTQIPATETLALAGFITGEDSYFPTTTASFKGKYLIVEKIGAIVIFNNDDLEDESYDVTSKVVTQVQEGIGQVFDKAVLFGTNKPASWEDGLITQATTAGNAITETADLYGDIFAEDGLLDLTTNDGFMTTDLLAHPSMKAKLRNLRDADGNPYYTQYVKSQGEFVVDGAPIHFVKNGSFDTTQALIIAGDFNQLIYGIRKQFTMELMKEATIEDGLGNKYNLASQDKTGIRFVFRVAWTCPNPVTRLNENNSTRFPFSVLVPSA